MALMFVAFLAFSQEISGHGVFRVELIGGVAERRAGVGGVNLGEMELGTGVEALAEIGVALDDLALLVALQLFVVLAMIHPQRPAQNHGSVQVVHRQVRRQLVLIHQETEPPRLGLARLGRTPITIAVRPVPRRCWPRFLLR